MRPIIYFCFLCTLSCIKANAQPAIDKVNKTIYDAERVKGTFDKFKGFLPKKKTTPDEIPKSTSSGKDTALTTGKKTVITVTGIDFAKLKVFNDNIRACAGVQSTSIKYTSTSSSIEVIHMGSTEELLRLMGETSKDIFTDKNLESLENGKISLKL